MKMNKGALIMALLMAAHVCNAAVLPSGSRFDRKRQRSTVLTLIYW